MKTAACDGSTDIPQTGSISLSLERSIPTAFPETGVSWGMAISFFMFVVVTLGFYVPAVASMAEKVHERAKEQQQVGPIAQQVFAMLHEQVDRGNGRKA